jgi:hypothetical protein
MQPNIQSKVEPIKVQTIPLAAIRENADSASGLTIVRFTAPSRRIHWTLQVGWTGDPTFVTKSWSVYPLLRDLVNGGEIKRLQPVLSGGTLPDGYEAESGVKLWEAEISLEVDANTAGRIFATIVWEPSLVDMCPEEHAYWAGLCTAERVGPILDIGIIV